MVIGKILYTAKYGSNGICVLRENEILYIESLHNNVCWHCRDRSVVERNTLKNLEAVLPSYYMRVHNGFLVNIFMIRDICGTDIELVNGEIIRMPKRKYKETTARIYTYLKKDTKAQSI